MSIASEISRISGNISSALTAISNKGVTVPSGSNSDDLADLIAQISGGGGTPTVIIPEQSITTSSSSQEVRIPTVYEPLVVGEEYIATVDGVSVTKTTVSQYGGVYLNFTSGYDISFQTFNDITYFCTYSSSDYGTHTIKVEKVTGGGGTTWETEYDSTLNVFLDWGNGNYYQMINPWTGGTIAENSVWRVTWDGVQYECTATLEGSSDGNPYAIGNYTYDGGTGGTSYPFFMQVYYGGTSLAVVSATSGNHLIKIEKQVSGGGATLITKTITQNGTYDAEDDDADGYSQVTVNVSGSSKNVQTAQTTDRRNNTSLGSIISLTCSTTGTYDVYWTCARSNTSQTWGSQLYIDGSSYDTENTTWTNNVQTNHLTNVSISANQTVAVYGRSRSGYYIHAPQLTIVQK